MVENWDPLKEDFDSIQNNPYFQLDNVEMANADFQTGDPSKKICRFFRANKVVYSVVLRCGWIDAFTADWLAERMACTDRPYLLEMLCAPPANPL